MELVCTITRQGFELESPNSHRMCILGPYRMLLKMGLIDLDLQGHFGLKLTNFCKFELGRTITHQGFKLESPYSLIMCILGPSIEKRVNWPWPSRSFTSNVYITISQEQVDRLTSDENYFDRWVTEKNLNVINVDHWIWFIVFLPLGKFCRRVLSLPPSVRLSVCPSVCLSVDWCISTR